MPTRTHRIRIFIIAVPLMLGMVALGCRLYDLQVVRHVKLAQEVNRMHERRVKLPALRGTIVDCNQNVLAHSVSVQTVVVDPQLIRDLDASAAKLKKPAKALDLARLLSSRLAIPFTEVQEKLNDSGRYVVLKKKVPEETVDHLRDSLKQLGMGGVVFEDDQMRVYPNGPLMSHVLGFVNGEQQGMDGIEFFMQKDLYGQDGWRRIEHDARGREIVVYRNEDFPARNGACVVLTLDQAIQNMVEQALDRAMPKYRPDSAVIIVMKPATGEILALANRPTFDPNSTGKDIETLKNRAVADLNEPGSTFKIVTIATALDHRIISLNDTIFCENGSFLYGGRLLHDHEPYGNLTVTGILVHSSNIGAGKVGIMLGNDAMYRAMRTFGFGEKAFGEEASERWPGEIRGIVRPLKDWSKVSITHVAMGHEVGVTPIQMANAMCALANGGNLMRPQIVKRVIDANGNVIREFFPQVRRRVVDQRAAQEITTALREVVSKEGTAIKAAIPGFSVAGKTGTAQKLVGGQYVHDQFVASFCGYFPAEQPELLIYVMLDNPKGKEYYGGAVAAPIFHDIGIQAASYLNIKPEVLQPMRDVGSSLIQVSSRGGLR